MELSIDIPPQIISPSPTPPPTTPTTQPIKNGNTNCLAPVRPRWMDEMFNQFPDLAPDMDIPKSFKRLKTSSPHMGHKNM